MGLDRAPIEFQTFYFSHVWLVPPSGYERLVQMHFSSVGLVELIQQMKSANCPGVLSFNNKKMFEFKKSIIF